ncbi:MAG: D-alanyl-D-alanine carboxypeptidase family protein [Anaerolineae bacterium]|jgi:D-alanyl-D-alanine carboxypeptidase (penicillin-binding protein 5/6)|nr:D-alanyl-D-alanine carboxypeptidase [Chloroflexota bacterium]
MRLLLPTIALVCLCALSLGFGPPRITDSDVAVKWVTPQQFALISDLQEPSLTAAAYLMLNPATGQTIVAHNENARRAPASLTKLVTAMVALEHGELEQQLTISEQDLRVWTMVGLQVGESRSLHDLLHVLLIPSDNAAADAIARGLGGTEAVFVSWMNEWVEAAGLRNSHFTNAHGLDEEDNYTSAWDMAQIALRAESVPLLRQILSTADTVAADRRLVNTNEMLRSYRGAVGVKTGTEEQAGECLITLVERPQGDALTVVLGSTDRYADSTLLLDFFYANYSELYFELPDTPLNRYIDTNGNPHAFGLREPLTLVVPRWKMGTVSMVRRLSNPTASPSPDVPVGTLEIYLAGQPLLEVPLYAR